MKKASEIVNSRWKDYVAEHGLTSGNEKVGWWTDVQHEALKLKGLKREKMTGKRRFSRLFNSDGRYIIKYHTKDHLTAHFIAVDCSVSPKLIIDSEKKQPEVFLEPSQLVQKIIIIN
jgi:hypothetical protein